MIDIMKPDHDEVELLLKYTKDQGLRDSILSGKTFSPVVVLGKIDPTLGEKDMPPPDAPVSCLPSSSADDKTRAAAETLKLL